MPLKNGRSRRRPVELATPHSAARLRKISLAFDKAVGYESKSTLSGVGRTSYLNGNTGNPNDSNHVVQSDETSEAGHDVMKSTGDTTTPGGFLMSVEHSVPHQGGGFVPMDESAGGFIPDPEDEDPEDEDPEDEDPEDEDPEDEDPEDEDPEDEDPAAGEPHPDFMQLETKANLVSPPHIEPVRIPLRAIPLALSSLNLPAESQRLLMSLFREIASDDEEEEDAEKKHGRSAAGHNVTRQRFVEACATVMADNDTASTGSNVSAGSAEGESRQSIETDETDAEDSEDEYRDEIDNPIQARRKSRRGPIQVSDEDTVPSGVEDHEATATSDESDSSDFGMNQRKRKGKGKGKLSSKKAKELIGKKVAGRRIGAGTKSLQQIHEAKDSFELFFEGSAQRDLRLNEKAITLAELRHACLLLNEKLSDDDLREMLEYASRSAGAVNLRAFTEVLEKAL